MRPQAMNARRTFALRLFVLSALLTVVPATVSLAQPGPPASVAFHSNRDGNNNIYVMDPDGLFETRITTMDSSNNQRADIAPDGRRIVFVSNRSNAHFEIFVMNADGSDVRQLTNTPPGITNSWPRWSPDGEWIAFHSNVSGVFHIYVIRPDGTGLRQITTTAVNLFPAWSPDGTRLAVRRDADIYVVDVAGSAAPVRLTTVGPVNQMAAWSADGTQIAFMSTRGPGNYASVFVMNADGSGQIDLTPKQDGGINTWSSRAPAWSPNGKYIYFTGIRPGSATEQIYVMRADGTGAAPLTSLGVNAEATVRHVRPPTITSLTATPNVLWPPDGRTVRVSVNVGVSDESDPAPVCRITGATSNESSPEADAQISGAQTVDLRTARFGFGEGRVYTLTVVCSNTSELQSTATVNVTVPHDQRK